MTWGWNARGALPVDGSGTGTTGGGQRGSSEEAQKTKAWPRYEAEYLKRALQSERYKYDTDGLDAEQRTIYLDKVTSKYKEEADECLKAEFDQWLQGLHSANDPSIEQVYENADGKPVRRWLVRSKESEDAQGHTKVGQARAGWKHTPWGRAALTGLPGVREYLREQTERANEADLKMQLLAEFGPQNLQDAWMYFKHWVKGRPLSDAVALPARFEHAAEGARSDFDMAQPHRMYAYDATESDRQPQVFATDRNAYNAAVSLPGEPKVRTTDEYEDDNVRSTRHLREQLESVLQKDSEATKALQEAHIGQVEAEERQEKAEAKDVQSAMKEEAIDDSTRRAQNWRLQSQIGPLHPTLG